MNSSLLSRATEPSPVTTQYLVTRGDDDPVWVGDSDITEWEVKANSPAATTT